MLLEGAGAGVVPFVCNDDDDPTIEANCLVAEEADAATLGVENLNGESEDEVEDIAEVDNGELVGVEKVNGVLEGVPNPLKPPPNLGVDFELWEE